MVRPKIRLAQDSEAEDVRYILEQVGQIPEGLDWSRVYPSWLVAEYRGMIVGCVQVLIGHPVSHMGFWAVLPAFQNYGFGIFLWKAAEKMMADAGSDGFTGMTTNSQVLAHLPKQGGVTFGEMVHLIFKRVYRRKENGRQSKVNHQSCSS